MARYLEVDLHRNNFTVCTIAENGRTYFREYCIHMLKYFAERLRPTDRVAVEVSTTTRLFYDAETLALFLSKGMLLGVRMKAQRWTCKKNMDLILLAIVFLRDCTG